MEKTKFKKSKIEADKRYHALKNILIIGILVVGAIQMCGFLALMQNTASEMKQQQSSEKILSEVVDTMALNDKTYRDVKVEFNTMNQTTIETLSMYIEQMNVLEPLGSASPNSPAFESMIKFFCNDFATISKQVNTGNIYLMDANGTVIICSDPSFVGRSFKIAVSDADFAKATSYGLDARGNVISNGTMKVLPDGTKEYSPLEADNYFTYSTLLTQYEGKKYFLLVSESVDILNLELANIKDISTVLEGVSVGKSGFLFAVNKDNGEFLYFNNGEENLSGKKYQSYGMEDAAAADEYVGYQTIDGVEYYCVTKEFTSELYGDYTVVAAVVAKDELLSSNITTIFLSCLAFVIMSCICVSYGMILRREIANQQIFLDKKYTENLKDEVVSGKKKYTDEEIEERSRANLRCIIHKGEDAHFKRFNLGTRNSQGIQRYFSKYVSSKMLPVVVFGLFLVYVISFFAQTLVALQDATNMSSSRLSDIQAILRRNQETADSIQDYVEVNYLAKARLISNMYTQIPENVLKMNPEDPDTHITFTLDEKGNKEFTLDMYGNPVYAVANSYFLQKTCENNNLEAIYIFDDQGQVLATNNDNWYFKLSRDPNSQSNDFYSIIDGKTKDYVQPKMVDDQSNEEKQYIGTVFYYYTYQAKNGKTIFATPADYESQSTGYWTKNPITKHRGLIQILINKDVAAGLSEITSINYVLSGLHVYSDDSFFVAIDNTDDHRIVYSPYKSSIGKKAADIGITDAAFSSGDSTYNGFQMVNGIKYYQSYTQLGDYYIATAIPTATIYQSRNGISLYTLGFSAIFMLAVIVLYSISSDFEDENYIKAIFYKSHKTSAGMSFFILATPSGNKKTSSASSRFRNLKWTEKAPEQKLMTIIMVYMSIASVFIALSFLNAFFSTDSDSIFTYIFRGNWEKGFNVFALTEATMILIMVFTVTKIVQLIVQSFCGSLGARVETTGDLLISVLRYGGILGSIFYCLHLFGFNTASLLTSAGILSLVIGLGAQSLISDILAGIFIVFEGEFRVGDIVTIGDYRGQVLEIGLRTTKIQDAANDIKIFNNNSITGVLNMTKEFSFAKCIVGIEYGEDLQKVEEVLKKAFPIMKKNLPSIIDGPFYKGVAALDTSSVNLLIVAACSENDRLQLTRDLNKEIFLCFRNNNINIPFPQVTLSYLDKELPKQEVTVNQPSPAENNEETTK